VTVVRKVRLLKDVVMKDLYACVHFVVLDALFIFAVNQTKQ